MKPTTAAAGPTTAGPTIAAAMARFSHGCSKEEPKARGNPHHIPCLPSIQALLF
jgi:hypothetical protein